MTMLLLALLVGVIAGLRALTAPAIVSWAAALGWLNLDGSWLAFLGYRFTPYVFTALALVEFVTDQLPSTPSRKVPMQFAPRLLTGALSGAAVGIPSGQLVGGLVAGVVGAVIGTYGGAAVRGRLAASFGKDRPAALIEDAVAILGGALVLGAL
ncbi:DUF4126 domain-containing protein [Bradyrhizobium sp. P5_C11_2]